MKKYIFTFDLTVDNLDKIRQIIYMHVPDYQYENVAEPISCKCICSCQPLKAAQIVQELGWIGADFTLSCIALQQA